MVQVNVKVPSPLVVHVYSVLLPVSVGMNGNEMTTFDINPSNAAVISFMTVY